MPAMSSDHADHRREFRLGLNLPVRVVGPEVGGGSWEELTETEDTGAAGIAFLLERRLAPGDILRVKLPMPRPLRAHDTGQAAYTSWGVVRDVVEAGDRYRVGMNFLDQSRPDGSEERGRRRFGRLPMRLHFTLQEVDEWGAWLGEHPAWSEDIGPGGMRVATAGAFAPGARVLVRESGGGFSAPAEVRHATLGLDRPFQLGLRFLSAEASAPVPA
jgi:hypothetical protein